MLVKQSSWKTICWNFRNWLLSNLSGYYCQGSFLCFSLPSTSSSEEMPTLMDLWKTNLWRKSTTTSKVQQNSLVQHNSLVQPCCSEPSPIWTTSISLWPSLSSTLNPRTSRFSSKVSLWVSLPGSRTSKAKFQRGLSNR